MLLSLFVAGATLRPAPMSQRGAGVAGANVAARCQVRAAALAAEEEATDKAVVCRTPPLVDAQLEPVLEAIEACLSNVDLSAQESYGD
eukprot:541336-Prymnesium_polylepis.1